MAAAPDVVLEIDHINPVSNGGDNDIMNLITLCRDCNQGKKHRTLDDHAVIQKQKAMLDELNQRREQLEMLMKWREELQDIDSQCIEAVATRINEFISPAAVNDQGKRTIKRWLKKYSLNAVLDSIDKVAERFSSAKMPDSADDFFNYIPRNLAYQSVPEDMRQLLYIRGIMRNRFHYVNEKMALVLMKNAVNEGVRMDWLKELALSTKNWTEWRAAIESETQAFIDMWNL
ncbi:HNH endonuclease [Eikenella sp. NML03-A-027]|uniref:HNH endonuclease n=2 Tax=Eikenella sp. NML03-A-027 TaxID=1795828 RepID=UPI0018D29322|nr:HNH endonuclease [Eikenella sp. NML03-A-027]